MKKVITKRFKIKGLRYDCQYRIKNIWKENFHVIEIFLMTELKTFLLYGEQHFHEYIIKYILEWKDLTGCK